MSERRRNICIASSLGVLTLSLSLALYIGGLWLQPLAHIRQLAVTILHNTYNPLNETLTTYSLNAVSAIIWDYRGVDTIYETTVLLASIMASASIMNASKQSYRRDREDMGLVARFSTRLTILITTLIAISTATHGHLTPGGGFQAGSMLTAIIAFLIPIFSTSVIYKLGFKKEILLYSRYIVLLLIVSIALAPIILIPLIGKTYIMQNQVKKDSQFSMPTWFIDTPLGGSIFFYNVLEAIAIALALSYALLTLFEYGQGGSN
ncbi:MAG: Na(+)/H(+) antiporter subunit B [Desulfurococcaceae archaeon]